MEVVTYIISFDPYQILAEAEKALFLNFTGKRLEVQKGGVLSKSVYGSARTGALPVNSIASRSFLIHHEASRQTAAGGVEHRKGR